MRHSIIFVLLAIALSIPTSIQDVSVDIDVKISWFTESMKALKESDPNLEKSLAKISTIPSNNINGHQPWSFGAFLNLVQHAMELYKEANPEMKQLILNTLKLSHTEAMKLYHYAEANPFKVFIIGKSAFHSIHLLHISYQYFVKHNISGRDAAEEIVASAFGFGCSLGGAYLGTKIGTSIAGPAGGFCGAMIGGFSGHVTCAWLSRKAFSYFYETYYNVPAQVALKNAFDKLGIPAEKQASVTIQYLNTIIETLRNYEKDATELFQLEEAYNVAITFLQHKTVKINYI